MSATFSAPGVRPGKSFDAAATERLEVARKKHEAYRDTRVRALGDEARLTAEIEADLLTLANKYNASGVEDLRSWIVAHRADVKAAIDDYEEMVTSVGEALRAVDGNL
jgi:hypothetical protein